MDPGRTWVLLRIRMRHTRGQAEVRFAKVAPRGTALVRDLIQPSLARIPLSITRGRREKPRTSPGALVLPP